MNNQFNASYTKDVPGFVFYESYYNALSELKPRQRLAAITAIMEYAFEGKKPELSGTTAAVVSVILPYIDSNRKRYLRKTKRTSTAAVDKALSDEVVTKSDSPGTAAENDKNQSAQFHENENKSNSSDTKSNGNCGVINTNKNTNTNSYSNASSNTNTSTSSDSSKCSDTTAPSAGRASPSAVNTHASRRELCSEIISDYSGGDSELCSLLESWLDIKKQRSQPITPESIRLNLEELTRITAGGDKKAYLREVIRRGWGTFFELEKKQSRQDGGRGSKSSKDANAKSSKDSGYKSEWDSLGDWDCERSFDLEEFDRFTLEMPV